jgi:hypothetical protein
LPRRSPTASCRSAAAEICPFVLDLQYKLLENKTGRLFITSDNPTVRYNQFLERRGPQFGTTGWQCKGLQIFLPLGPRHLLMLYDGEVYRVGGRKHLETRVEITNEWDVEALNILQAANAEDVLYFHAATERQHVLDAVTRAGRHRRADRIEVGEYDGIGPGGERGRLLMASKVDLRTGLDLLCVGILPSAAGLRLDNPQALLRDPEGVYQFQVARMGRSGVDARGLVDYFRGR